MPRHFDFEVELQGIAPRIWRRFLLRESASFLELHAAIQDACGWENDHPFRFLGRGISEIGGIPYDDPRNPGPPEAALVPLRSFFPTARKKSCRYVYDFGDMWVHEVTLRGVVESPQAFLRRLTGGARAFPPEDCGGLGGYQRYCEVLRRHEQSPASDLQDDLEWLGDWRPEAFDLARTKKKFDRVRAARAWREEE